MKKLLLEGGVGGHLNHLYDNRQMTYNKMVSILKKASNGELVGTEKADGYNIFLGYRGRRWLEQQGIKPICNAAA